MRDEGGADRALGEALARAIERQPVGETAFERSRLWLRLAGRRRGVSPWALGAAAAAAVLALAVLPLLGRPPASDGPVAAGPTVTPSAQPTATPSPTREPTAIDHQRVYFARDGLPPIGVHVDDVATGTAAEQRISSRLAALGAAGSAPAGTFNAFPRTGLEFGGTRVRVTGELATVDFTLPRSDWGVRGAAQTQALLQQIVYTATEEPGIRRVLITQNDGRPAAIDQLVVEKPLSREDVFGYRQPGSSTPIRGFGESGGPERRLATAHSVDEAAPGLARFVITVEPPTGEPRRMYPDWNVSVERNDESARPEGGKWRLVVRVSRGIDQATGTRFVERTPLRAIHATTAEGSTTYELALDDLRPWRTALLFDPLRIIVDIGGHPQAIAARNAIYEPLPGATVESTLRVSGIASAFEANVQLAVLDSRGLIVARAFTTATNCCEPGGTFTATIQVPAAVSGRVTLEVFEASARDGSPLNVIRIPLTVR